MRFGFCAPLEHLPILTAAGYDYVEPPLAATLRPEQAEVEVMPGLKESLAAPSITPEAFNVFLPGDLKVVGEAVDEARQGRYLQAAFARAAALGGRVVVFGSGRSRQRPDGFPAAEARRQVTDFLRRCGPLAAAQGVTVAIEPLHASECNFINGVSEAAEIAQAVGHPAIKVLSDLYHVSQERQSFEETRGAGALLQHVHVAGAEGRRVPTAEDVDYLASFFRVLKEMGYGGRISVEGHSTDLPRQAAETLDTLRRAWEVA
ncbi:MAG: sugar phosphate isomerase/epimerase [Armatimonadetes bacterium]|nr:sugar phosphate isomerase/epimerase [Armatimonadota bacterium]